MKQLLTRIDHLVYAVPDLHEGIAQIERLTGVRPVIGGRHQTEGTWNALMQLGPGCYFELLAPDPDQTPPPYPSWRDTISHIESPQLVRWCTKVQDLKTVVELAQKHGIDIGKALPGSREKADGTVLSWTLTDIKDNPADGIIPFFIHWGNSPHPSQSLPEGCRLLAFEAVHPEAEAMMKKLSVFDLPLKVYASNERKLIARLETPKGEVVLM